MRLSPKYLTLSLGLFFVELFLALYVRDDFFRPIIGDLLVVVLLYALLRSFCLNSSKSLVIGVCLFAYFVECVQYFDPIGHFGLEEHRALSIIVGRTFSWIDLLAYSLGSLVNLKLTELDS